MTPKTHINVYGAGLAGCEAAWQAAERGVFVTLYEMKPKKYTPAHHSEGYAELVCSNSLRSDRITVASGLLKEELSRMGSLIMEAARATQVAAGSALAVDRDKFSAYITEKIQKHPLITVVEEEVTALPEEGITVVATGPLTSDAFADWLKDHLVGEGLHFFDGIPKIQRKLQTLFDVGLGYVKIGQSSTTLSGGEAQRVKLAAELAKRGTGKTIYILDEPTTGLHTDDVSRLLTVLQRLCDGGNTVLVIEHNLDVIKCADHIIDLGPEGGAGGGTIVATGTPEEIAGVDLSYTGQFLRRKLHS